MRRDKTGPNKFPDLLEQGLVHGEHIAASGALFDPHARTDAAKQGVAPSDGFGVGPADPGELVVPELDGPQRAIEEIECDERKIAGPETQPPSAHNPCYKNGRGEVGLILTLPHRVFARVFPRQMSQFEMFEFVNQDEHHHPHEEDFLQKGILRPWT